MFFLVLLIKMVKLSNLLTASKRVVPTSSLAVLSPALAESLSFHNNTFGFTPDADGNLPSTAFRVEAGQIKVGNITLKEFVALSTEGKAQFLNDPDVFDASTRANMNKAIDVNYVDEARRTQLIESNRKVIEELEKRVTTNGIVNTNHVAWVDLMGKLGKTTLLGVGLTWTYLKLKELAEKNSGCFLIGPNGEEQRLGSAGSGGCTCAPTTAYGDSNPYHAVCCTKCKLDDSSLVCPGDTPSSTASVPYTCPEAALGGVRSPLGGVRSVLSIDSATALAKADVLGRAAAKADVLGRAAQSAVPAACHSCGCSTDWKLCERTTGVMDVINDLVSDLGNELLEGVDGVFDIVASTISSITTTVKVIIAVGAVVGAAVLIGVVVSVVRKRKKALFGGGRRQPPVVPATMDVDSIIKRGNKKEISKALRALKDEVKGMERLFK